MKKNRRLYFDINATTPFFERSKIKTHFANPSALYQESQAAKYLLESSRSTLANLLGCDSSNLIFTGSATEANNQVLMSVLFHQLQTGLPSHVILSSIEHSSLIKAAQFIQKMGVEISFLPVEKTGQISLDLLKSLITPRTRLISIMAANNEVGTLQPLEEITKVSRETGCLFHTDAVQMLGKSPFSLSGLDVDFATFSGHKVYAPKGVGLLYAKEKSNLLPLCHGGGQEYGLRSGTENVEGVFYFAESLSYILKDKLLFERLKSYQVEIKEALKEAFSEILFYSPDQNSLPNLLNFSLPINAEALVMACDIEGIAIGTGSACSTGSTEPSHVLRAMGVSDRENKCAVRVSFGAETSGEEVHLFCERFVSLAKKILERKGAHF